ncbi:hypothetical protein E2562_024305 [Oryza meyeriana var. granulata]|uniref:DUF4220 domain-containing protein n=1 Tax=Oryza meyeriana var. granulata TaxID=110450 RepID=A0A6G1C8I4_9ORYZ|nr:hypothetical protein E2562_024305 [Oryza meyeriana var. granulata]
MLASSSDLAPAVEGLWNAWEIHCLIVVSLLLQVLLFLFAGWRRCCASPILGTVLWLAYLSADSVAVFVLGHLAVHASEPGHQLLSFWAPFVLVHLGGQDTITALSRQDNELWKRHLLQLAIQTAVAGYVVGKASWPDRRLKLAMVLMFISGFFKYAERIMYLFSARPNFLNSPISWKLMEDGAKEAMEKTLVRMSKGSSSSSAMSGLMEAFSLSTNNMAGDTPLNKVATITLADDGKLPDMLKEFQSRKFHHKAYEYVGALLVYCYRRLYTKQDAMGAIVLVPSGRQPDDTESNDHRRESPPSYRIRRAVFETIFYGLPTLFPYVAIPMALALFVASEKGSSTGTSRADIMVSYLLLVGAVVLEVCSVANFFLSYTCLSDLHKNQWSEQLGQYNIIKGANTSPLCRLVCGRDVERITIPPITKEFILDSLLASGTRKEWNIASTRGQLALRKWPTLKSLEESVRSGVDFPTTVLIWHIATCMCSRHTDGVTASIYGVVKEPKQLMSMELSNYIMYLVFKCNVMLTTTSQVLHDEVLLKIRRDKDAVMEIFPQEINKVVEHEESKEEQDGIQIEHEESKEHMKKLHQSDQVLYSPDVLLDRAREVAQELINGIRDEAERWELISAVWAEMIYYTAPRCGAAFHYEHICTGGEFITHVFVLMYLLGPFLPPPAA